MLGSAALEMVLRLLVVFGLFSLAAAMVLELLSGVLDLRRRCLRRAFRRMLSGDGAWRAKERLRRLFDHPLTRLSELAPSPRRGERPARLLSIALLDALRQEGVGGPAEPGPADDLFNDAPTIARRLPEGPLRNTLTLLVAPAGDGPQSSRRRGDRVAEALEVWVAATMREAAAAHRMTLRYLAALIGLLIAFAADLDLIAVLQALLAAPAADGALPTLSLGWSSLAESVARLSDIPSAFASLLGWIFSGLAISFGAAVWLAALGRVTGPGMLSWTPVRELRRS
ncbi:MAG: hypothetical protein AAGE18_07075 [Pseudomonadota bacterium]